MSEPEIKKTKKTPPQLVSDQSILIAESLIAAWQAVRGEASPLSPSVATKNFPISAAQIKKNILLSELKAGLLIEGQGIYLCRWTSKDSDGESYHVFVAPEDLPDLNGNSHAYYCYDATRARIGMLEDWYGFNGKNFADAIQLYRALKDGNYNGEWIIPPDEILCGRDSRTNVFFLPHNIYDDHNIGDFRGTYATSNGAQMDEWYWSCTPCGEKMNTLHIKSGIRGLGLPLNDRARCRPIRLVAVSN